MAIDAVSRGADFSLAAARAVEADLVALSAVAPSAVTADRAEGTSAFLNTRKPAFHGN